MINHNFRISVIIPTKDREEELYKCLLSIANQSILPYEIIIVDDGRLPPAYLKKAEYLFARFNVNFVYYKKKERLPSTARSKNLGAKLSIGDIIFYFDDDVILDRNYIEEILNVYKKYPKAAGVSGLIVNPKRKSKLLNYIKFFFGLASQKYGKISPAGYNESIELFPDKITQIDWMPTGCASYKRKIFLNFLFDEEYYKAYSLGEDLDLSYRISRKHLLLVTPKAKLWHYPSKKSRLSPRQLGRMQIQNYFYFFKKNIPKSFKTVILFSFVILGSLVVGVFRSILKKDLLFLGRLEGVIRSLLKISNR